MPESTISKSKRLRPVSLRLLAGLILISLLVAYFLLPTHRKLLERQLRDGKTRQALATLRGLPAHEREQDPAYFALLELRLFREVIDPENRDAVFRQIIEAGHAYEAHGFRADFLAELLPLIPMAADVERVHRLLKPRLPHFPLAGRQSLYLALANTALAANQPTLAPKIFLEFWEKAPPSEEISSEMARFWRLAGQPDRAVAALENYLETSGRDLSYGVARLRVDLLRETGQPGKAFDALRDMPPHSGAEQEEQRFELLVKTALESSRTPDALPLVRERAEKSKEDPKLWKTLGELAVAAGDLETGLHGYGQLAALEPEATEHWVKLGQLSEWTSQPNRAFDHYLKALRLHDTSVIQRLASLSMGLFRDAELAQTLDELGDLVDPAEHRLDFARLYGRVGHFERAKKLYRELLEAPENPFELLVEYGTFLHALLEFEPAYEALSKAAALKPNDLAVLTTLAEIQFRLGNYQQSLRDYYRLIQQSTDLSVFETYLNLAESLGDLEGAVAGLRIKLKRDIGVSAYDYERLAAFLNLQGKSAEYLATLREALDRFPDQTNLRETAAYAFSDSGQYHEAARLLDEHPGVKTKVHLAAFYLSLQVQLQQFARAEAFLAEGLPAEFLDSIYVLEVLAYLNEASGRNEEATRIYARLHQKDPRSARYALNYGRLLCSVGQSSKALQLIAPYLGEATPDVLQWTAQVYSAAQDYRQAEKYQRLFLASSPRASNQPQAWGFLGDIFAAQGQRRSAARAYQRGLAEMVEMAASPK